MASKGKKKANKDVYTFHEPGHIAGFPRATPFPANCRVEVDWDAMEADVQPFPTTAPALAEIPPEANTLQDEQTEISTAENTAPLPDEGEEG